MKYFYIFLLVAVSINSFGQGIIKGKLEDEKKSPVPYATVVLKNSSDSSIVKNELSDESGQFVFEGVKEGEYFAEFQFVGFQKTVKENIQITTASPIFDIGVIKLSTSTIALKGITIQADKPFIERLADRTVVNVENSPIYAGASVIEVMEKLPGVQVSQDGAISLKGRQSVNVMIDGKQQRLSSQDLASMLQGMQSASVQKIEIISNPSAKFDAEGNAGIINIITKKNRRDGLNGSISAGYGQGRYEKTNTSLNLSYKEEKYNLFLNYAFSHRKGFNNLRLTRNFYEQDTLNTIFETDNYIIMPFNTHNPRIGADFTLSPKSSLSIMATTLFNELNVSAKNHTDILNGNGDRKNSYDFSNNSYNNWFNYTVNTQFKQRFDTTDKELTVDLDFADYLSISDHVFTTTLIDDEDRFLNRSKLAGNQNGKLKIYSVKSDYSQTIKHKIKMETGFKSSLVESDNDVSFFDLIGDTETFDSTRSTHFIYKENINAAYLNLSKDFKKLSFQLGLRGEYTFGEGEELLASQNFTRNYIQLFPSFFLDYKLNKDNGINFNLSRRIDRPAYQQLNPFRRIIDATTYSMGNPYLLPELTCKAEIGYSYKNSFFAALGYSVTNNNITQVLIQDAVKRETVQTTVNLEQLDFYSLNLTYSKRINKWWNTNTSILSFYGIYKGEINDFVIDQGMPSFNFNTSNSLSITENLSAEVNFLYNHRNLYGVTLMRETYNLTIGLQKVVLKKQGSITLNVTDIFWKAYPSGFTDFGNVNETWSSRRDTRVVNLNFSYRFGNGKPLRSRRSTGADEEKRRAG